MRIQSKTAVAYMFRNFWRLVFYIVIPSVLIGIFAGYGNRTEFVVNVFNGTVTKENYLPELMSAFSVLRFGKTWWVVLIAVLLLIFGESLCAVKIGRHMRIGVMSESGIWKEALFFSPRVAVFAAMFLLASEVMNLIAVGLAHLFVGINVYAMLVVTLAFLGILQIVLFILFGMLVCTLPASQCEEYKLNIAMSYSVRLMTSTKHGFFAVVTSEYCVSRLVVLILGALLKPYGADVILYVLLNLFWLLYIPCLAFKTYYDRTDGERRDLSRIMFG